MKNYYPTILLIVGLKILSYLLLFSFQVFAFTVPPVSFQLQLQRSDSSSISRFAVQKQFDNMEDKFHFSIDRGGTFTDVHCILPKHKRDDSDGDGDGDDDGDSDKSEIVLKLLSVDPSNYEDAPTEGIRRILQQYDKTSGYSYERKQPVPTDRIGSIRMGTTVATNALLERQGEKIALLTTKGFKDLLAIGNQSRKDIFDLTVKGDSLLFEEVVEVEERVMLNKYMEHSDNVQDVDVSSEATADAAAAAEYQKEYVAGRGTLQQGITGEDVRILQTPHLPTIRQHLQQILDKGIRSIAIVFMHSFTFAQHEVMVGQLAQEMGFTQVSLSSEVMPMVKMVPRGHTACAAAYLTPSIQTYLKSFKQGFDENLTKHVRLTFMKSDGGLTPVDKFGGHQAILSGPAGGVIGYAKTTYTTKSSPPVIGFDMGGTSTDVSRYAGHLEHVFETTTAGISIQAPQLDINTVAAGGGSRLFFKLGRFVVGPESAGAHPGPVCYRKNGYLAVTDANVVLGRVLPEYFPSIFGPEEKDPLDVDGSRQAFETLLQEHSDEIQGRSVEEIAYGFLQVANEAMCRPIRNLTQMKGFDITTHILACFGGAGPQHACAMAKNLGMKKVFVHRYGGVLSAYGLSMADAVHEEQEPAAETYHESEPDSESAENSSNLNREARFQSLEQRAMEALMSQGYETHEIRLERYLNMRYDGTDNAIMIQNSDISYGDAYQSQYKREFGFELEGRDILIDDYRVRAVVPGSTPEPASPVPAKGAPPPLTTSRVYFENGWEEVNVYKINSLEPGHEIMGPSIIVQPISTVVLEIGCTAIVTRDGDLDITVETHNPELENEEEEQFTEHKNIEIKEDPVQLSIFGHRFMGIAEQMGRTLARTSISVNIKERLDFSCALFTPDGGLVANAPHIPVHLGAMQSAVRFQIQYWNSEGREGIQEGDVLVSNHPQLAGGSHLPDITVMTPVFHNNEIIFFVASRGHHADIGGIAPGSMPPHSKKLEEEGAMIIAFKLVKDGVFQEAGITDILHSPAKLPGNFGTRNLKDNLSDLKAQVAANNSGIRLLHELVMEYGLDKVHSYMNFIQKNAELAVRTMLKDFANANGPRAHAMDYMDDGTPIELTVEIDKETGDAVFDFTGTGPQVLGNHNAPPAVTYSAVIYSLRSMVGQDIPLNQGCLAPITFIIPEYTLLNPSSDAGVVGGNVLTSQRIVDVVLRAFRACAASQGCMNNLTFGDDEFGYYETIAGGAGAGPGWVGRSGVHTHCTNTRITDPEILERRYPVLLREFSLREGSGGVGEYPGGCGVIREIEPLRPLVMSILSERRTLKPYGMEGGGDAKQGRNLLVKKNGMVINIGGRCSSEIDVGDRIRIETPGGGGYGSPQNTHESTGVETSGESFEPHATGSLYGYINSQMTA